MEVDIVTEHDEEVSIEFSLQEDLLPAIRYAITMASEKNKLVKFLWNSIKICVEDDSNPDLIYRDHQRALKHLIPPIVGPYPKEELSELEKLREEFILVENAFNELRQQMDRFKGLML